MLTKQKKIAIAVFALCGFFAGANTALAATVFDYVNISNNVVLDSSGKILSQFCPVAIQGGYGGTGTASLYLGPTATPFPFVGNPTINLPAFGREDYTGGQPCSVFTSGAGAPLYGQGIPALAAGAPDWYYFFYGIDDNVYYANFHFNGTTWAPVPPVPPRPSFTTFTLDHAAGLVEITGYWIASSTSPGDSQSISYAETSGTLGPVHQDFLKATTTGDFSFTEPIIDSSFQISATSTSYTLGSDMVFTASLFQNFSSFDPFENTGAAPELLDATSTSLVSTSTATVNVGSSASLAALPEAPCGLTELGGCLKNAAVWLFYPTGNSISQFGQIQLQNRFPFAYIYQLGGIRQALFTASSTAPLALTISLWDIPGQATTTLQLISETQIAAVPFAGTIYNVLTWVIWLGMAEYIYYRVIRVHDTSTPS